MPSLQTMRRQCGASLMLSLALLGSACATASPQASPAEGGAAVLSTDEYTLAPGDKIHVIVFGEDTLTGDYVITSGGNLSFPLVGNLPARNKTVEDLQTVLTAALANGYLNNPRVNIQVVSFRPFYILGEVNRPGEYPVQTGLTLQQAVAAAGGYTYRANTRRVFLKRANDTQEQLKDLRDPTLVIIHAGDTIRIGERHF